MKVNNCLSSQENMMQDLTAVRELCMKLDQTRESLSRQLAAKTLDHEQVRQQRYYNVSTILKPLSETRSAKRIFLQKTCGKNIRSRTGYITPILQDNYNIGTVLIRLYQTQLSLCRQLAAKSLDHELVI